MATVSQQAAEGALATRWPGARRSRRRGVAALASLVAAAVVLAGCLPIPDVRHPLDLPAIAYRMDPRAVQRDYLTLPGYDEPHTPASLDHSYVLRFRANDAPDAVLVLMPGIFGGASSLETLARQLVASDPSLQVWAVDRRSNALEDRSGFRAAVRAGSIAPALDYYLGGDGAPPAFRPPDATELAYMGYWGLTVHLRDLGRVVTAARAAAPRVYLGGHSLGASLVALYAAYLLPGGRTGASTLDGLVLLDGVPGRTGAFEARDVATGRRILGVQVLPSVDELERGSALPYLSFGVAPGYMIRQELVGYAAALRPNDLAPPRLASYPITNLALAGVTYDGTYSLSPLFAASVGEAVNARYAGNLPAFLLGGADALGNRTVVGVAPGADHVGWSAGDPPAPTDLSAMIGSWTDPESDRAEWYFPTRLLIDIAALPVGLVGADGFVRNAEVRVPTLAIGAGKGLVRDLGGFATYANARAGSPFSSYIVPGLSHADLVMARDAPVAVLFERWVAALPR